MTRFALFVLLLWTSALAAAGIELADPEPVAGRSNTIRLAEPATRVVVIYRPNSGVERRDTLLAGEPATLFPWTPRRAGVVRLEAGGSSRNVPVRFEGISWGGIVVMLIAAVILFGGAFFAMRRMLRHEPVDFDPGHLPDT